MNGYYEEARRALDDLLHSLEAFKRSLQRSTSNRLEEDEIRKLERWVAQACQAIVQLFGTLHVLEKTSLDIVDLHSRLKKEVRDLIKPLKFAAGNREF